MPIKKIIIKIILWFVLLIFLGGVFYAGFFLYKINSFENKIANPNKPKETVLDTLKSITTNFNSQLKESSEGRLNILLLGIGGKENNAPNLTDTIMIASINLKTNQVALLSIPRDLYVTVPSLNVQTKINAVYQLGLNSGDNSAKTIEDVIKNITDLDINYYAVLNFQGFRNIINAIGGINITSERDIYDATYPGPNNSYEIFKLDKGFHHMDGATALKYARERHDDPQGDFGRAKRQQQIIQATKNKIFSASTLFDVFAINNLVNALGENIKTDISTQALDAFFELSKQLDTVNINNVVIDAWKPDSLLKVSHIDFNGLQAFVLIPRIANYSEIQELAQNIFDLNKIKRRQAEIAKENASVMLINQSGNASILKKILNLLSENFGYKKVSISINPTKLTTDTTYAYDLTNGIKPFTLDELTIKLPAQATYTVPDNYKSISAKNNPDIIVVIGKDLIEKYNMAENSVEEFKKSEDQQSYLDITNSKK
jgi:LCP family protein required for cell wall assembly